MSALLSLAILVGAILLLSISTWPETKKDRLRFVGIVTGLVVLVGFGIFYWSHHKPSDVRALKSYKPQGTCQALSPGCGYCPGYVEKNKCYVLKEEFKQYQ